MAEAAYQCGCRPEELVMGALGAKEEKDKVRTIHDGTVVNVNPRIQEHIPERQTYPQQADLFTALATEPWERPGAGPGGRRLPHNRNKAGPRGGNQEASATQPGDTWVLT